MKYDNLSKTLLLEKIEDLEKALKLEKENNEFLLGQQRELRRLAEEQGSERAKWKVKALRLEEKTNVGEKT